MSPERKGVKHRLGQISTMARSQTSKNSLITFSGNIASTVISVFSTIIISRALGPAQFGVLAIYTSLVQTLLGLTDFGLGTTAIKLISANIEQNRRYALNVMRIIFRLEVAGGLIIGIVGLIFAKQVAIALGGENLTFIVQIAFFSSIFSSAGAFIGPFFIAFEQFYKNAFFGVASSLAKVAGIVLLSKFAAVELNNVIYLYMGISIAAFFLGLFLSPRGYLSKATREEDKAAFNEIFHFSKWILLSYFATVIGGKLDIFLLIHYKGATAVGLYAAAQQLTSVLPLVVGALTTVLLPRVTRMKTRDEFYSYMKKALFGSVVVAIALLPFLIFGNLLIHLIFGAKYVGSILAYKILFLGYISALLINPISLILYAINQPKFLTFVNYGSLIISAIINIIVIPRFGINGAALTFLIANTTSIFVIGPYTLRKVKALPN